MASSMEVIEINQFDILYCVNTGGGKRYEIWTVTPHQKDLVEFNLEKAKFGMVMRDKRRKKP